LREGLREGESLILEMSKRRELTTLARGLRRQQTIAERNLWARLRNKQIESVGQVLNLPLR
jgi:very-short-patch-repair endonuclease